MNNIHWYELAWTIIILTIGYIMGYRSAKKDEPQYTKSFLDKVEQIEKKLEK